MRERVQLASKQLKEGMEMVLEGICEGGVPVKWERNWRNRAVGHVIIDVVGGVLLNCGLDTKLEEDDLGLGVKELGACHQGKIGQRGETSSGVRPRKRIIGQGHSAKITYTLM